MKKILCMVAILTIVMGVKAQGFDLKTVNGAVKYSINNDAGGFNQLGFEAGVTFDVAKNLEFVPAVSYFVKNKGVRSWALDADVHYNFNIERSHKIAIYPLAGLAYKVWSFKIKDDEGHVVDDYNRTTCNKLGFNVGGGVSYRIDNDWTIRLEGKYQWFNHKYDQGVIGVGVSYTL